MQTASRSREKNPMIFFIAAVFLLVILRSAWMSEDAYITLRSVDNFVHGYGLVWNIGERVQTYTDPLWMFMLSVVYFVTRESFYTTLWLSIALSLGAFVLIGRLIKKHNLATLSVLGILIFSKAFVDYSTSGLENPVTHLLLALFLIVFLLEPDETPLDSRRIFIVSLIAGLSAFNRMDTLLFFIPALILIIIKRPKRDTLKWMTIGFLPFILWEVFSIIYYGFPFPNTAYAKLNTGLSRPDLFEAGYLYLINSLHWDPITLLTVSVGIGLAIFNGTLPERSVATGVLLYILYIIWIGGDYMSGRFLSGAVLIAVGLLIRYLAHLETAESIFLLAMIIIFGFISPTPTLTSIDNASYSTGRMNSNNTIRDERSFFFQPAGLLYDKPNTIEPFHEWVLRGLEFRNSQKKVYIFGGIGFIGYFGGTQLHIIDPLGLGDALIARIQPGKHWMAGHNTRAIPAGYEETVRTGENHIQDADLAQYYDQLSLIIRGNLWSLERWAAIWKMNTGQYDYLLNRYNQKQNTP